MNAAGSGLSRDPDPRAAVDEAVAAAVASLDGRPVDVAAVFLSAAHADGASAIADRVADRLGTEAVIGALAPSGAIGAGLEAERGAAVAVWAASLPGAEVEAFALEHARGVVTGWPEATAPDEVLVLLADPYTFPVEAALRHVAEERGGARVVGGFSGGGAPGLARLVLGGGVRPSGAVGLRLRAEGLLAVVSQGCRPLGPELVVTAAEGSAVAELAGVPALEKLEEVLARLPAAERLLAARGIMAGIVIDENRPEHGVGDYLVRGIVGADRGSGALVIGDAARIGKGFRFHVRDAAAADEELRILLGLARGALPGGAAGALLFTCNGRGRQMFEVDDHDAGVVRDILGVEAAGLFCQGELGPVGGVNHVHGFTATVLVVPRG